MVESFFKMLGMKLFDEATKSSWFWPLVLWLIGLAILSAVISLGISWLAKIFADKNMEDTFPPTFVVVGIILFVLDVMSMCS